MDKKSFKKGDKVKLKNPRQFKCGTKVLTVIKEAGKDNNKFIHVIYEGITWEYFPLYSDEVKYAISKGQQLIFSFMKGE